MTYTRKDYGVKKIDVVILPSEATIDFIYKSSLDMPHIGIIYLPFKYIDLLDTDDMLDKMQAKSKIIHLISVQLARHWFYNFLECNNKKTSLLVSNYNLDVRSQTISLLKIVCKNVSCSNAEQITDNNIDSLLGFNDECFLHKGIINWISYLAFQMLQPDLVDLVHLEWDLIREIDDTYFSPNQDINFIYQTYDFPRLTYTNEFQTVKTELKVIFLLEFHKNFKLNFELNLFKEFDIGADNIANFWCR
jgi:hypothetical protein